MAGLVGVDAVGADVASVVLLPEKALLQIRSVSADFCCHILAFTGLGNIEAGVIGLGQEEADDLEQLVHLVWRLSGRYPFRAGVVRALLTVLLEDCAVLAARQRPCAPVSRNEEIFKQYLSLVAAHALQERGLSFYAGRLCISVHYLCECVHAASGHYPKYWIDQTLVSEAKYLLNYTDRSSADISAELNFANPAFFCRFFKRETGLTPGQFRKCR